LIADLQQRLSQYRKRYARHVQRKLAAERAGKKANQRTLAAIENNAHWVHHYETALAEAMGKNQ
jgi:hypothetical protein